MEDKGIRLQKFLARCGVGSRRHCEKLIDSGLVSVNGKVVEERGSRVDPEKDEISIEGRTIRINEPQRVIMMNKPMGYVSTRSDPRGDPTVYDLLPEEWRFLFFTIGRLDKYTEGLLLFTNNGELAYRLTHPKFSVDKTYELRLWGKFTMDDLRPLEEGVLLGDGITSPARVSQVRSAEDQTILSLTIHEGRKRQIRRMCKRVGLPLRRLKRYRVGPLELSKIRKGQWRFLTEKEIRQLSEATGIE